uniref:Uncharacterized protein n=1 Tax=Picea sitchensis TaxID=3332 RepID=D5AC69_PICSI|nr:unknown [Picea sitchensis]
MIVHMISKLAVGSELGSIDNRFFACMSSNSMESILQRTLIDSTFEELTPVAAAPCQYLQIEDAETMDGEKSESGWTMYLDHCVDSWSDKYTASQFAIEQQQKKSLNFTEAAERYPTYDYWSSSFTGNEEEPSLVSDASSGRQKIRLPVQDIEFEQGRQMDDTYSSYYSVVIRERDVHVDKGGDSECIASCSLADVAPRKSKFRRLKKNEHDDLLLQDTAASPVHNPQAEQVNTR